MYNLWQQLLRETNPSKQQLQASPAIEVRWRQSMEKLIGTTWGVRAAYRGSYLVSRGLSIKRKKAIALRIMLDVAYEFEKLQTDRPFSLYNDSGFSQEDLISDMVAYYKVVEGIGD